MATPPFIPIIGPNFPTVGLDAGDWPYSFRQIDKPPVYGLRGPLSTSCHGWRIMAQSGHYAKFYNTYFHDQSLEYIEAKSWRIEMGEVEP
jgi:hypothetical protein